MADKSEGYEIIEYRPELRDQVLRLQTLMWSSDLRINGAYLDWKYHNNPYGDQPIIYLAMQQGQVVGMRGLYVICCEGGQPSQTFYCLQLGDGLVHPDHRRRGLLVRMMTAAMEGFRQSSFRYVFTLSSNQFTQAAYFKLGWRSLGDLQPMQRPAQRGQDSGVRRILRQMPLLPSIYRRMRTALPNLAMSSSDRYAPFEAFDRRRALSRSGQFSQVRVDTAPRPEAMAKLVGRLGHDGRLRYVRDQKFFAWRFQNPLSQYRFLYEGENDLEGYLVLQMSAQPGEAAWCTIVDWEAANSLVRKELLQAAVQWGNFDNLVVWSGTLPDQTKSLLGECGFSLFPKAEPDQENVVYPSFLVGAIRPQSDPPSWTLVDRQLLDVSNWDLRAICSDNF